MATAIDDDGRETFPDEDEEVISQIFQGLAKKFHDEEVLSREEDGFKSFYIEAPTARRRLNEILGYDRWEHKIQMHAETAICHLTIHLPNGRSLTRAGVGRVGPSTNLAMVHKGAATDAFKRACVEFGIAEYLYLDEPPAPPATSRRDQPRRDEDRDDRPSQGRRDSTQGRGWPRDAPPRNGDGGGNGYHNGNGYARSASEERNRPNLTPNGQRRSGGGGGRGRQAGPPTSGKGLYSWANQQEEERGQEAEGLVKHLMSWGKREGIGVRLSEWSRQDVDDAYEVAQAFLRGPE